MYTYIQSLQAMYYITKHAYIHVHTHVATCSYYIQSLQDMYYTTKHAYIHVHTHVVTYIQPTMHILYEQTNATYTCTYTCSYIHTTYNACIVQANQCTCTYTHCMGMSKHAYNVHIHVHVQYLHTKPTIGTLVHLNIGTSKHAYIQASIIQIEAG